MDPEQIAAMSNEALDARIAELTASLNELFSIEQPTPEDYRDAQAQNEELTALRAAKAERDQAVSGMSALRESFSTQPEEDEESEDEDPEEDEDDVEDVDDTEEAEAEPEEEKEPVTASARSKVARRRSDAPPPPERQNPPMAIIASADVPGVAPGSKMDNLSDVTRALIAKVKAIAPPKPAGIKGGTMHRHQVATFQREFPEDLVANGANDYEVLQKASKEARLPGGSLVAAGGWCAPSETLYDLCANETTDGLLDLPEIEVRRGGLRWTTGPDFSTLYAQGFVQTEAEAIAGEEKDCYEIECPDFTERRLDAVGLCIKVPLLTQAAWPELVENVVERSIIAHAHRVSVDLITRISTLIGAGISTGNVGSVSASTLNAVELVGDTMRQNYRLAQNETLEVVAPFWLRSAIRADLAMRNGVDLLAVSNQQIDQHFAARGVRVQWVYGYQSLAEDAVGYPATAELMIYPAGSYVKGTLDVVNLDAVYDAAELNVNRYTGLFMEEGVQVYDNCYAGKKVTIPVCAAGTTGAADNTECFTIPETP